MEVEVEENTDTLIVSVNRKAIVMVFTPAMTGIAQAQVKKKFWSLGSDCYMNYTFGPLKSY